MAVGSAWPYMSRCRRWNAASTASSAEGGEDIVDGDTELEGLAAITQIERAEQALLVGRESLEPELAPRGALHLGEEVVKHRHPLAQWADASADVVVFDIGGEQPQRREVARVPRHQDRGDADGLGQGESVHRTRAAEGDQGEVAGVVPALDRDLPDGRRHAGHGDGDDTFGELLDGERSSLARGQIGDGRAGADWI